MSGITVTMPLREYEAMKTRIKQLEKESVRNYIDSKLVDVENCKYETNIDTEKIILDFDLLYGTRLQKDTVLLNGKNIAEILARQTSLQDMGRNR